jgi:hypothetical protein
MERIFRYLISSLFIVMFIILFCVNIKAQPINPDGGFEEATLGPKTGSDIPGWTLFGGDALADFEIMDDEIFEGDKSLSIIVSNLGTNAWDIQVVNEPFDVESNTTYYYSVWIIADIEGSIVDFTVGDPSYQEWGRAGQVAIGTEWQQVTFEFTTPVGAISGRAPIHFGETANQPFLPVGYYVDDLEITTEPVGVNDKNGIPYKFSLKQNYPNPFNPITTIVFTLPERSDIRLVLVNILGNVVKEIASGNYGAGEHRIKLDASGLSSGIYFYRLEAGSFSSTKKLILMK